MNIQAVSEQDSMHIYTGTGTGTYNVHIHVLEPLKHPYKSELMWNRF